MVYILYNYKFLYRMCRTQCNIIKDQSKLADTGTQNTKPRIFYQNIYNIFRILIV